MGYPFSTIFGPGKYWYEDMKFKNMQSESQKQNTLCYLHEMPTHLWKQIGGCIGLGGLGNGNAN